MTNTRNIVQRYNSIRKYVNATNIDSMAFLTFRFDISHSLHTIIYGSCCHCCMCVVTVKHRERTKPANYNLLFPYIVIRSIEQKGREKIERRKLQSVFELRVNVCCCHLTNVLLPICFRLFDSIFFIFSHLVDSLSLLDDC